MSAMNVCIYLLYMFLRELNGIQQEAIKFLSRKNILILVGITHIEGGEVERKRLLCESYS